MAPCSLPRDFANRVKSESSLLPQALRASNGLFPETALRYDCQGAAISEAQLEADNVSTTLCTGSQNLVAQDLHYSEEPNSTYMWRASTFAQDTSALSNQSDWGLIMDEAAYGHFNYAEAMAWMGPCCTFNDWIVEHSMTQVS